MSAYDKLPYFGEEVIGEGTMVRVEFSFYLPVKATDFEVKEWLEFELHTMGGMHEDNPLAGHDIAATWVTWKSK